MEALPVHKTLIGKPKLLYAGSRQASGDLPVRSDNPDIGLVNFRSDRPFDYRLGGGSQELHGG